MNFLNRILSWALNKVFPCAEEPFVVAVEFPHGEDASTVMVVAVENKNVRVLETFSFDRRLIC